MNKKKKDNPIEDFNKWLHEHCKQGMIYRGLKDSRWDLEASLYRRLKASDAPKDMSGFIKATEELIEKAKKEEHHQKGGKDMKDLKLLSELQHIGAATCLIDFTGNPLIALWFACQPVAKEQANKEIDGKLYTGGKIVALNPEDPENLQKFKLVNSKDSEKSIETFLNEGQLWKWSPPKQIPRVIAQQSAFILGKGVIEENEIDETYCIDKEAKESILKELEKHDISESSLFCDFAGFAQQNAWDKPYQNPTSLKSDDYIRRAISTYQSNDLDKSIEYCNKAIEINSENATPHYLRGIINGQRDDYDKATIDFDKAIRINPRHEDAHCLRGGSRAELGDHKSAIISYDKAININSQFAEAYYFRGLAQYQLKNHKEGEKDYRKAIELNPDNPYFISYDAFIFYKYYFKVDNKIVHVGATTDIKRREKEHQQSRSDWKDGHITRIGHKIPRELVSKWEDEKRKQGMPVGP